MATWTRRRAEDLDRDDPIGWVRERFVLPPGLVYLDGNSLGPLPRAAMDRLRRTVEEEWGAKLAASWNEPGWMDGPVRAGGLLARLVGAEPDEVVVTDPTTISLTKLVGAALRHAAPRGRHVIVTTTTNFPTDLYAMDGMSRAGAEVRRVEPGDLADALDPDVALLAVTHVDFRTGEMLDLPRLTEAAHAVGALALFDLCHSAGAVPVGLRDHGVDLAVGCTYKYLNGGPGAPAFLYVRRELQDTVENPLPGWIGHAEPFDFSPGYEPAEGIRRFLTSTPPVIALAVLEAALVAFDGVSIEEVRLRSVALTELFIGALDERVPDLVLASPRDSARRGSQVSVRHPDAAAVIERLAKEGVVGDFRPPDICRFGFGPMFLGFAEVFDAAERVAAALGQPSSP